MRFLLHEEEEKDFVIEIGVVARLKLHGQFGDDIPQATPPNFPRLIASLRNHPDKYVRSLFSGGHLQFLLFLSNFD